MEHVTQLKNQVDNLRLLVDKLRGIDESLDIVEAYDELMRILASK